MPDAPRPTRPQLDSKGRLQSPTIDRPNGAEPFGAQLPELADMVSLQDHELHELLDRFGVSGAWQDLRSQAMQYAADMGQFVSLDPDNLRREVERLIAGNPATGYSRRALLGMARETQRAFVLDSFAEEGPNQEFIRICENDESSCSRCPEYAGIIGTLGQHAADPGLPGAATCDGGFYCRCQLVILD